MIWSAYLGLATAIALFVAWRVAEDRIRIKVGSPNPRDLHEKSQDRGSSRGVLIAVLGGMGVSLGTLILGVGILPWFVFLVGAAAMVIGITVRCWALSALGRHFSNRIRTTADQEIVRSGPYRLVRHPAYTGFLLIFLGFPLVMLSGLGFLVFLVLLASAVGYRIRIEEEALVARFGAPYEVYRKSTWRLIPYVV
jgi:protein-S-isoprenylcysteine O-methyltransferase Ste14